MKPAAFRCPSYLGLASLLFALLAPPLTHADAPSDTGLLFYLSGEKGTTADFSAGGTPEPTFDREITRLADGAKGAALQCSDLQLLAYRAPGNIYAQRGTLSFFWRSRYPVGPTAFPLFRVAFADHSSWDMVWLRIDYNGHGFDAFVTDASLARIRVSYALPDFPKPEAWVHLALAWDETYGIRFYVNGRLAAENKTVAFLDTGLDQFGPHSRIISPWQVQSDYNFVRGGDLDELRIYDRMLADDNVAMLARGDAPTNLLPLPARDLANPATRAEWWQRYGWNRPDDPPPALPAGPKVAVRKVEIHDAYDLKRWWWKACDGIRETTWPGVYNRSRLPGRNDYFQLPDWDCYVDSGKAITFALPNEPWNHLEISGAAWGKMELLKPGTDNEHASGAPAESVLFERPPGQEKTVHRLPAPITGRQIRFTNVEQEEPIGELAAYNVTTGAEPGVIKLAFRLVAHTSIETPSLAPLQSYVAGRFVSDERATLIAQPVNLRMPPSGAAPANSLPLVHVLIPNTWDKFADGLDGIAIDLPALAVKPTHGDLFPLNIQVKDPLWLKRNMLDFTFSVKPGEAKTLWLDLRDRILPKGKALYLTVAGAGSDFGPSAIEGAQLRLVFKPREAARAEYELDRFTQAKDSYAMLVEEHPKSPKLDLWNRFETDINDLMRINPNHHPGRNYAAVAGTGIARPAYRPPAPPVGVPLWAFRQVELLGRVEKFVLWYIDHRQVAFGDFGGGISDDVDLLNTWPGTALMGCAPDKIGPSLHALLEAAFKNGMFTDGLPTIQADELHSYEEGINCLAQNLVLDYGSPRQLERAMVTARSVAGLTGINAAGHRHIRTSYYSGTKMATEDPWGWAKAYSYLVLQPGQLLVDFNGNPDAKKIVLELADGLLAHRTIDATGRGTLPSAIHFATDREGDSTRAFVPWHLFWSAWKWTGDRKYISPILDNGPSGLMSINANALDLLDLRSEWGPRILGGETGRPVEGRPKDGRTSARSNIYRNSASSQFAWQLTGDKKLLEALYAAQIEECDLLDYINTEGSLWIDRVGVPNTDLQRARLGGISLVRNGLYPGHVVSWKFAAPATGKSVAILIPNATATGLKIIAYNLETKPVAATLTAWNVDPGQWEVTQGLDTTGDDNVDGATTSRLVKLERSADLAVEFAPRATTILTLKLKTPGTPYWSRPDLGIERSDVTLRDGTLAVNVHSLGSVPSPETSIVFKDRSGRTVASATIPPLEAPVDLQPRTAEVILHLPTGTDVNGGTVQIDPEQKLEEITQRNNTVKL